MNLPLKPGGLEREREQETEPDQDVTPLGLVPQL